jgi:NitT/TauT family transport system substrate-binding protein
MASAAAMAQQATEIRIAQQFGIAYLPLTVAHDQGLVERFAREAGLGEIRVTWEQFSGGSAMNDALLTGNLDVASAGVPPMITIWDRTRGQLGVRAIAALGSVPNFLTTNNPNIHRLRDFGETDRIALPSVKVGFQPVVLQMAAEQEFGPGHFDQLDPLTVSMAHPDALIALLSGKGTITAHFTSPPFQYQELKSPQVHRVLSSYEVLGGPHTFDVVYGTGKFRDANPKLIAAFVKALDEACRLINADPRKAAEIYLRAEKSALTIDEITNQIRDPDNNFTITPQQSIKFAEFQFRNGLIKQKPESWKDLFFPEIYDRPGS